MISVNKGQSSSFYEHQYIVIISQLISICVSFLYIYIPPCTPKPHNFNK